MTAITDHQDRYALTNELHARPFPTLGTGATALYLAVKRPADAARRDRQADLDHLLALLDHFGADHPRPGATHYSGRIGGHGIKWESHTEFVSYTLFVEGKVPDGDGFGLFPDKWLKEMPGVRLTSAMIRVVEKPQDKAKLARILKEDFVPESLAVSNVLDGAAIIAGDFRIDARGQMNFQVISAAQTGSQRIGRIVQRLCEIETYKAMSMLGYRRAKDVQRQLGNIDMRLNRLIDRMNGAEPEAVLAALLPLTAELEALSAQSAFRFSGTRAYSSLVADRIMVLRERRVGGRQTFEEFMARRFEPTMRTSEAVEAQLQNISARAFRAAELLRTRVEVERSAQNQQLLESMDRRADQQLHLQKTVEGLSVVAISYYAVNLATYAVYPLAKFAGLSKATLTALLIPPVIGAVWLTVRRIRNAFH